MKVNLHGGHGHVHRLRNLFDWKVVVEEVDRRRWCRESCTCPYITCAMSLSNAGVEGKVTVSRDRCSRRSAAAMQKAMRKHHDSGQQCLRHAESLVRTLPQRASSATARCPPGQRRWHAAREPVDWYSSAQSRCSVRSSFMATPIRGLRSERLTSHITAGLRATWRPVSPP